MNRKSFDFKMHISAGLAALALALIPASPASALVSPGSDDAKAVNIALSSAPASISAEKSCQDGLQFGMTADKIPDTCHASLIKAVGQKEKWEYLNGFLFFDNGALMAIREVKP